ncbi:MAG: DegT/DnrJ/EryC1/StrS family aminotransferase [Pseudomonadota bacterium]
MSRNAGAGDSAISAVPLLDLKAQYETIRDEVELALREVCDSQYFVLGPKVAAFEEEVAAYCRVPHAIGMSSGTDALLAALMAFGIGPGDEVITSPYSFFSTAGTIARLGARPVFCDIDANTYNLDPTAVERFLRERCEHCRDGRLLHRPTGGRVRAIVPVHLFGQLVDMDAMLALAGEFGLHLIEDAAQAIGAEDERGRRAGSRGDIGCFSFFPSKNLGAFGDGGLCVARDPEVAERLRVLRVHGGEQRYYHSIVGGNFRLDALQAAILSVKLRYLDTWTSGRQANAEYYDGEIAQAVGEALVLPVRTPGYRHVFNQYVVRLAAGADDASQRESFKASLRERGIGCEVYYPVALHLQQCFAPLGYRRGDLPAAEQAADRTLAIPVYSELTDAQQDYVVSGIARYFDA